MLAALCLAVFTQAVYGPTLPAGSSPDLGAAFATIEEPMSKGDFAQATTLLKLLPTFKVTYSWDDSKIPAAQRKQFADARDEALKMWSDKVPGLTFKLSDKPQIKFSFEPVLATVPDTGLPRGIALFFSTDPATTRMEAVIGLKRGNPAEPTSDISVFNEVLFAAGSYLGLGPSPFLGMAMGRQDYQMQSKSLINLYELGLVSRIQNAIRSLKDTIDKKERVMPTKPSVVLNPETVSQGPVVQGTPIEFSIQLNNVGQGAVSYLVQPDCGCISATSGGLIDTGGSGIVQVRINTSEIAGTFSKHLMVITNDAENPVRMVPINVRTTPRYRFIPETGPVAIVGDEGMDTNVYFVTPEGSPLEIKSIETVGNPAQVSYEPWKGDLADPELDEASRPREGYKIKLHIGPPEVSGRSAVGLIVKTGDSQYGELRYTLYVQRGIAVLPSSLYFGEIGSVERRGSVVLTRPNHPFKVTKVEVDSAHLKVSSEMSKGETEYRINVAYDGKAASGDFHATVTVYTDDPKQGKIMIPVIASVR